MGTMERRITIWPSEAALLGRPGAPPRRRAGRSSRTVRASSRSGHRLDRRLAFRRARWRDLRTKANRVLGGRRLGWQPRRRGADPRAGEIAVDLDGDTVAELARRLDDPLCSTCEPDRPVAWRYTPNDTGIRASNQNAPAGGGREAGTSSAPGRSGAWDISKGAGRRSPDRLRRERLPSRSLPGASSAPSTAPPNYSSEPVSDEEGHQDPRLHLACSDTDNRYVASLGFDCNLGSPRSTCAPRCRRRSSVRRPRRRRDQPEPRRLRFQPVAAIDCAFENGSVRSRPNQRAEPRGLELPRPRIRPEGWGDIDSGRGLVVTAAAYDGQRTTFAERTSGVSVAAFGASSA